jgi:hypothetical protein
MPPHRRAGHRKWQFPFHRNRGRAAASDRLILLPVHGASPDPAIGFTARAASPILRSSGRHPCRQPSSAARSRSRNVHLPRDTDTPSRRPGRRRTSRRHSGLQHFGPSRPPGGSPCRRRARRFRFYRRTSVANGFSMVRNSPSHLPEQSRSRRRALGPPFASASGHDLEEAAAEEPAPASSYAPVATDEIAGRFGQGLTFARQRPIVRPSRTRQTLSGEQSPGSDGQRRENS